jgi:ABC-2 type transport system permease protein
MISLVQDRENDFAQEMFVAPVSRYAIIGGKILGETMVSLVQVVAAVGLAAVIGVPIQFGSLLTLVPLAIPVAVFGGAFGLLVMANISEQRTVNQLFPFLIFPQFFLAGVFNPIRELPLILKIASRLAPMTYAVDLMRSVYYQGSEAYREVVLFNPVLDLVVVGGATLLMLVVGTALFVKNERNR